MKPHELDVVSLLAGLVFLVLGGVGLLQGAGVIDSGTPWALIGAIAAIGITGVVVSLRRLAAAGPSPSALPETTAATRADDIIDPAHDDEPESDEPESDEPGI